MVEGKLKRYEIPMIYQFMKSRFDIPRPEKCLEIKRMELRWMATYHGDACVYHTCV